MHLSAPLLQVFPATLASVAPLNAVTVSAGLRLVLPDWGVLAIAFVPPTGPVLVVSVKRFVEKVVHADAPGGAATEQVSDVVRGSQVVV